MKSYQVVIKRRWESRRGKYWLELHQTATGWGYREDDCDGNLGAVTEEQALKAMNKRIACLSFYGVHLKEVKVI